MARSPENAVVFIIIETVLFPSLVQEYHSVVGSEEDMSDKAAFWETFSSGSEQDRDVPTRILICRLQREFVFHLSRPICLCTPRG